MTFGENIKYLRKEKGYSLKQVEDKTGIPNGNLSRYERDLNIPGIELCVKLANLYGVTVDCLVGNDDNLGVVVSKKDRALGWSDTVKVSITPIEDDMLYIFRKIGQKYGEGTQRKALEMLENMLDLK